MATDATGTCNMALSLLGDKRILDFGETDTKEGRYCKLFYEQTRDEVIAQSGVEFRVATKRDGPLSAVSDEPSFGWDFAYQVPSGTMRILSIINDDGDIVSPAEWHREGDLILTNEETIHVLYIAQIESAEKFTPSLARAIYTLLAAKMAIALLGGKNGIEVNRTLLQEYEVVALPNAKSANAAEGFIEKEAGEATWTTVGRS